MSRWKTGTSPCFATLSRPEIAELAEGAGGPSSTMPHKRNPAFSVLVRRAALAAPGLAATMHLAAGTTVDERPDGAADQMRSTLAAADGVRAEQQSSRALAGLDRRSRSLITRTALVARGHHEELALHVRAALTNGLARDEIRELLLQSAIYCGVPDVNAAFRIAQAVLDESEPPTATP